MSTQEFQGKHYLSRSWKMLTKEIGWAKPVFVLSLALLIPIVGVLALFGYANEWARLTAWGVDAVPKQRKVDAKACIVSGARSWVVYLIWSIPAIAFAIFALGLPSYNRAVFYIANILLLVFGTLGLIAAVRAAIYTKLRAGLNFARIFDMCIRDAGGVLRVIGIILLFFLIMLVVSLSLLFLLILVGAMLSAGSLLSLGAVTVTELSADESLYIVMKFMEATFPLLPFALFILLFVFVVNVLVVTNAVALWMRQFDVKQWGASSDPLPEKSPVDRPYFFVAQTKTGPEEVAPLDGPETYVYAPAEQVLYTTPEEASLAASSQDAQTHSSVQNLDQSSQAARLDESYTQDEQSQFFAAQTQSSEENKTPDESLLPDPAQAPAPGTYAPDALDLLVPLSEADSVFVTDETLGDKAAAIIEDGPDVSPAVEVFDPIPDADPVSPTEEFPRITEEDIRAAQAASYQEGLQDSGVSVGAGGMNGVEQMPAATAAVFIDDETVHVVAEDELEAVAFEQAPNAIELPSVSNPAVPNEHTAVFSKQAAEVLEDGSLVIPLIPIEPVDELPPLTTDPLEEYKPIALNPIENLETQNDSSGTSKQ